MPHQLPATKSIFKIIIGGYPRKLGEIKVRLKINNQCAESSITICLNIMFIELYLR